MQAQTAMGAALMKAGANVGQSRLYSVAADLLRKADRRPLIAHDSFVEAVEADPAMMAALIGREELARRALEYLQSVSGDMSGTRGGGRIASAARVEAAPAATPSDGDGQDYRDTQVKAAASSEPHSGAGGHHQRDTQAEAALGAGTPTERGPGQPNREIHELPAPLAFRPPNPPRGVAALALVQSTMAKSIMDTYRIDGRSIGDWTLGEAATAGKEKSRHGALLLALSRRYANADPSTMVRDAIKLEDLQREIQRAAETADAA